MLILATRRTIFPRRAQITADRLGGRNLAAVDARDRIPLGGLSFVGKTVPQQCVVTVKGIAGCKR